MLLKRHWYPLVLLPLTLISDVSAVFGAYLFSYWLRSLSPNGLIDWEIYVTVALANGAALVSILAIMGLYQPRRREARFDESISVMVGLALAIGLMLIGVFFVGSVSLSRLVILYTFPLAALGCVVGRLLIRSLSDWARGFGYGVRQILILGTGAQAVETAIRLRLSPGLGYSVAGYLGSPTPEAQPYLGELADLATVLQNHDLDEVWFAFGEWSRPQQAELLGLISQTGIQVRIVPDVVELLTTKLEMDSLGGVPLLSLRPTPLRYWHNRAMKRALDIVASGLGLIAISPLLILIALWVRQTSMGPIFYRQERMSRDGESFYIYKFRSMYTDSEVNGPGWTKPGDQRVTSAGKFLRRTSLDELPQLFNVFLGEMSLVGPRPERPVYVEQFQQEIPKYLDRHLAKTGITGWAQIHGLRGDTSIPERVRFDLYYIENWSILLDLRILLVTVLQVFRGQYNAY